MKKNKKGFTLIELLVVLGVIGIIMTLSVISFRETRTNTRDMKRISDIKQIQSALELYRTNEGSYPTEIASGQNIESASTTYLNNLPTNPTSANPEICSSSDYIYTSDSQTYTLNFCLEKNSGALTAGYHCATPQGISNTACPTCGTNQINIVYLNGHICNTGSPDYDTCTYDVISIGDQCWLKQNINIGTIADQTNNNVLEKRCYGDNYANCQTYGGLYQWGEAIQYLNGASNTTDWSPEPTEHVQGLCPIGWHIPTNNEWSALDTYIGGGNLTQPALKSQTPAWDGLDTYGFSGLPGGYLAGSYDYLSTRGYFWSSSITNSTNAFGRWLQYGSEIFDAISYNRTYGSSVRCLKN
ncbi:MAG: FISUMP domain-containing protein [Patescibacteria group bacterium]